MYLKLFSLITLCVFLSSCGTVGGYYKGGTLIAELKLNKPGAMKVKDGEIEIEMDSRSPNIWEKNIVPIFQGAVKGTQTTLGG